MKTIDGYDVKIFTDNIDEKSLDQIKQLVSISVFSDKKVRIMPDVHAGAGCVIGFTGDLGDKVIPNIVGVDIGCGIRVLKLGKLEDIDFHSFNEHILANIPSGTSIRDESNSAIPLSGECMEIYFEAERIITQMHCYGKLKKRNSLRKAIGTLGGGNHFIELDKDSDGNVYLVIHTGSRNLGKQVAEIYQEKAIKHLTAGADEFEDTIRRTIEEYKTSGRRSELQDVLLKMRKEHEAARPSLPAALCYIEGESREHYLHDMRLCQQWAVLNRKLISLLLVSFFPKARIEDEFESVHNYISNDNIIRKGAISAAAGERCIIPLNMRDGALLCTGKGNPDWNHSAPHGAGRILSRAMAYNEITLEEFKESMTGIYSESVNDFTRDESPMVYKPAGEIISNIGDTVNIDALIRPIFNFKSSQEIKY